MKRRNRIWICLLVAVSLAIVMHFIYISRVVYLEKEREYDRFIILKRVLTDFNTLIISSNSIDAESFLQGKEPFPSLVRRDAKGKPIYSWRFAEFLTFPSPLPHDLPWTANEYKFVREETPFLFCHEGNTQTIVFAIGGPDTAFDQINPKPAKSLPHNLILFADVFESNTHWMKPGDFNIETIPGQINVPGGFGSSYYRGFFVVFFDGQLWHLQDDTPIKLLNKFCTIKDAKETSRDLLEPYCISKQQFDKKELIWLEWDY